MNPANKARVQLIHLFSIVVGGTVHYNNVLKKRQRQYQDAVAALDEAKSNYDDRDMSGSQETYRERKAMLMHEVKVRQRKLEDADITLPPSLIYFLPGAIKGYLFPVTVPYYFYRRRSDPEYTW